MVTAGPRQRLPGCAPAGASPPISGRRRGASRPIAAMRRSRRQSSPGGGGAKRRGQKRQSAPAGRRSLPSLSPPLPLFFPPGGELYAPASALTAGSSSPNFFSIAFQMQFHMLAQQWASLSAVTVEFQLRSSESFQSLKCISAYGARGLQSEPFGTGRRAPPSIWYYQCGRLPAGPAAGWQGRAQRQRRRRRRRCTAAQSISQ